MAFLNPSAGGRVGRTWWSVGHAPVVRTPFVHEALASSSAFSQRAASSPDEVRSMHRAVANDDDDNTTPPPPSFRRGASCRDAFIAGIQGWLAHTRTGRTRMRWDRARTRTALRMRTRDARRGDGDIRMREGCARVVARGVTNGRVVARGGRGRWARRVWVEEKP